MVNRWALKNFALCICCNEEEFVVWGKGDGSDSLSEVKVSKNHSLDHVDDEGEAVNIDADESTTIWGKDQP